MARPAKSVVTSSGNISKAEFNARLKNEQLLKGDDDKIIPPEHLNEEQKAIFNYIVEELRASGILGNLDIYILSTCSIAIERLQQIERTLNEDIENIYNGSLMSAKDKYTKDLFRCASELSLSPQSRAKLGSINLKTKQSEADPLLKILRGD